MNRVERPATRKVKLPIYAPALLALLAVVALPGAARAQWTQPDANNNISNTNAGRVGIGATSPDSKLVVSGNASVPPAPQPGTIFHLFNADSTKTRLTIDGFGIGAEPSVTFRSARGTAASPSATQSGDSLATMYGTGYGATNFLSGPKPSMVMMATENWTDSAAGSAITFNTVQNGTTLPLERLRINNDGNVGIGTTSPSNRFHVHNSSGFGMMRISGAGLGAVNFLDTNAPANQKLYQWRSEGGVFRMSLVNDAENSFVQQNILVANSSGSVGVATATPNSLYKLDVAGSVNTSGGLCIAGDCKTAWSQVGSSQWTSAGTTVYYNTGNVGVGTTSPGSKLFVGSGAPAVSTLPGLNVALGGNSYVSASNGTINTFIGSDTSSYGIVGTLSNHPLGLRANNTLAVTVMPDGKVGIGTSSPTAKLHIISADDTVAPALSIRQDTNPLFGFDLTLDTNVNGNLTFNRVNNGVSAGVITLDRAGGNVGIGVLTQSPTHTLEVAGTINASQGITGATINATYQDVAEWVPSTQKLQAGTVVVLDTNRTNHVLASSESYDTRVAGVVSAQPGITLGEGGGGKLLVATTGRVKVKVDATRAPIRVGDLLVTSDAEGVAMKSVPVDLGGTQIHRPGTIIGKALEPMEKGTGEILVLLSLQ